MKEIKHTFKKQELVHLHILIGGVHVMWYSIGPQAMDQTDPDLIRCRILTPHESLRQTGHGLLHVALTNGLLLF